MDADMPAPASPQQQPSTFIEPDRTRGRRKLLIVACIVIIVVGIMIGITLVANTILSHENHVESVQNAQVSITRAGLTPATIKIGRGMSITWTNQYKGSYRLTSDDQNDFSANAPIDANTSFTAIFSQSGTYHYHVTGASAVLNGTIIVQ